MDFRALRFRHRGVLVGFEVGKWGSSSTTEARYIVIDLPLPDGASIQDASNGPMTMYDYNYWTFTGVESSIAVTSGVYHED